MGPRGPSARRPAAPCKFFASGQCRRGDSCTFSHDAQLAAASDLNGVSRGAQTEWWRAQEAAPVATSGTASAPHNPASSSYQAPSPVAVGVSPQPAAVASWAAPLAEGADRVERAVDKMRVVFGPGCDVQSVFPSLDSSRVLVFGLPPETDETALVALLQAAQAPSTDPVLVVLRAAALTSVTVAVAAPTQAAGSGGGGDLGAAGRRLGLAGRLPLAGRGRLGASAPPKIRQEMQMRRAGLASFASPAAARAAVLRLQGSYLQPDGTLSAKVETPFKLGARVMGGGGGGQGGKPAAGGAAVAGGSSSSATLRVQWYAPSRCAYANFESNAKAVHASERCHGKVVRGRVVECSVKPSVVRHLGGFGRRRGGFGGGYTQTIESKTVRVSNLGGDATEGDVRRLFRENRRDRPAGVLDQLESLFEAPNSISLESLRYDDSDMPIRLALGRSGRLVSFEMQPSPLGAPKRRAIARFDSAAEAAAAVRSLHLKKVPELGFTTVTLTQLFSSKFTVLRGLFEVIRPQARCCSGVADGTAALGGGVVMKRCHLRSSCLLKTE